MSCRVALVAAVYGGLVAQASADLINISSPFGFMPSRRVTAEEVGGGAPMHGYVHQWRVTTDADILSVNNVQIMWYSGSAALYNNPFGDPSNANPGNPLLIPTFPALGVDSWITTPSPNTARLGPDLPGDGTTTFGDLQDNGPQTDFVFAQITLSEPAFMRFTGRISIASSNRPGEVYSVRFRADPYEVVVIPDIPEPTTQALAGLGLIAVAACRRRSLQCRMKG
jgi:hypothetical protein